MAEIIIDKNTYKEYEEKMDASLRALGDAFNTIRAGRANPRLLDNITVDYYGSQTPLSQVANIQVPEARLISITPWEVSMLKEIERAILASDLGITPMNDGKCIRLSFPPLTEDRRKDLTKEVSKMAEEAKISVRNARRDGIDTYRAHLKKKEISEDQMFQFEEEIQKLTDSFVEKIDQAAERKNKELMEV